MENRIKEYLDGRPVTWLAKQTRISRNTLNSYIKGAAPSLPNAYTISAVFNKTVYDVWPLE